MPFYWFRGLPDCSISLETLGTVIQERYQAYNKPSTSCEYDFDVNSVDSVGHLFMCIIANEAEELNPLILKGELKLFIERINNRSVEDLKNDFQILDVLNFDKGSVTLNSRNVSRFKLIVEILKVVSERIDHVFGESHREDCRKYKINLPFHLPLNLMARREIELQNGKAKLYCGKWKKLLQDVFEFLLQVEIATVNNSGPIRKILDESEDDRIRQIIKNCVTSLLVHPSKSHALANRNVIDEESQYFPPCMANLHQILRRTHRLSYDSRYQYTLFLKDAGLRVEENLLFWEEEYSKPHCESNCKHDWDQKKKRYTYQIRHMYGLIGSVSEKTSHPCDKFTQTLTTKMDGGCPFVQLSKNELINSLPSSSVCDIEDILSLKDSNQPQKACAAYLSYQERVLRRRKNLKKLNNASGVNVINRPIDFYFLAKNISSQLKGSGFEKWL